MLLSSCKKEETKKESLYPTTTEEVAQLPLNWERKFLRVKETVS
jgi:cytochrome c